MKERASYLINPFYITCLLLLLSNDFYFKPVFANELTGKLSDFSGLVVFYGLLCFFFGRSFKLAVAVALFFIYWKSPYSQVFIDLTNTWSPLAFSRVVDYWDLMALPMLPLYYQYMKVLPKTAKYKAFVPVVLPFVVFSISATSYVNTKIQHRYDNHVTRYYYSVSKNTYHIDLPISTVIRTYEYLNYTISDSFFIDPPIGKVYSFIPKNRCTLHVVFHGPGITNTTFDAVSIQLETIDNGIAIKLRDLTLCHDEGKVLSKEEAIRVFENVFLSHIKPM